LHDIIIENRKVYKCLIQCVIVVEAFLSNKKVSKIKKDLQKSYKRVSKIKEDLQKNYKRVNKIEEDLQKNKNVDYLEKIINDKNNTLNKVVFET